MYVCRYPCAGIASFPWGNIPLGSLRLFKTKSLPSSRFFSIFGAVFNIKDGAKIVIIFNTSKYFGDNFQLMSDILTRIEEISSKEGISIGAMERSIGASKGVLSRAINNKTDIQAKWLIAIGDNYPQYSAEWLLRGAEPVLKNNSNSSTGNSILMQLIHEKDDKINSQAEEIGRLKERIRQMTIEKEKHVSDVSTPDIVNVV